jgi:hypothetical protein
MIFAETRLSSIKSISQRTLALSWARAAGCDPFPRLEAFQPPSRGYDPKYIVMWSVESSEQGRIFRGLYQGDHIATGFRGQWVGRSMADVIPESLRATALEAANFCAENGRAIYMIYRTVTEDGTSIDCERMLLPFGCRQTGVRQVLASNEPISFAGNVNLSTVLDHFNARFEIAFAGWFTAALSPHAPATTAPTSDNSTLEDLSD